MKRDFFFVYYSGHGIYQDASTFAIFEDGSGLNLTEYIECFGKLTNHFVIAFLDCCRELSIIGLPGTTTTTTTITTNSTTKTTKTNTTMTTTGPNVTIESTKDKVRGNLIYIYATQAGSLASGHNPENNLSFATSEFLKRVKSIHETFPKCILGWDLLARRFEIVVRADMEVIISPKINRKKIKEFFIEKQKKNQDRLYHIGK